MSTDIGWHQGIEQYSLVAGEPDGLAVSMHTNDATGDFASWLEDKVSSQRSLDGVDSPDMSIIDMPEKWLTLGPDASIESASPFVAVMTVRDDVDLAGPPAPGGVRAVRGLAPGRGPAADLADEALRRVAADPAGGRRGGLLPPDQVRANIDESRRPWRRERASDRLPEHPADVPTPVEERSALFDALQTLPEQQRKVVVLRHWLGLSVREAATELGISEGTVKSRSSRGLSALEAVLSLQRHV